MCMESLPRRAFLTTRLTRDAAVLADRMSGFRYNSSQPGGPLVDFRKITWSGEFLANSRSRYTCSMATAPTLPLVPVDEYLQSSYRPDVEYVDGCLVERSVPTYLHSLLEAILIAYFRKFEKECKFKALPELRTQIVERARYRIPDILLCATPTRVQKIMNETPLAVIEILSPGDTVRETLQRFGDYARLGVGHIIQMDPETAVAHKFQEGSLLQTTFDGLRIGEKSIPFNSEQVFAELRREIDEAAAKD